MRIGELAARTRVAPRLIRYYEQQGLLDPPRAANGYREYTDDDAERVVRVAGLVRAGLTTRLVRAVVTMEDAVALGQPSCPRDVADQLAAELGGIEERIACLTRSRDTIRTFLARTERDADRSEHAAADAPAPGAVAPDAVVPDALVPDAPAPDTVAAATRP